MHPIHRDCGRAQAAGGDDLVMVLVGRPRDCGRADGDVLLLVGWVTNW